MINCLDLIIFSLATWRIAHMVVWEDGPWDIIGKTVGFFTNRWELFRKLLSCVWCLSVWVAIFITLSAIINRTITVYLMLPFALSAIAVILEEKING